MPNEVCIEAAGFGEAARLDRACLERTLRMSESEMSTVIADELVARSKREIATYVKRLEPIAERSGA
jgi:hypothetical protein